MTALRNKVLGAFVALVVAAVAYEMIFRSPAARNHGPDEELVTLIVRFDPMQREGTHRPVVTVTVAGITVVSPDLARRSPWIRIVDVAKGRVVTLIAEQTYGSLMECEIRQREHQRDYDLAMGPGRVECNYQVGSKPL